MDFELEQAFVCSCLRKIYLVCDLCSPLADEFAPAERYVEYSITIIKNAMFILARLWRYSGILTFHHEKGVHVMLNRAMHAPFASRDGSKM